MRAQVENEADPEDSPEDSDADSETRPGADSETLLGADSETLPGALYLDRFELYGALRTRPGLPRRFVGDVWAVP